ncbi:MAG TPA: cysteine hydrolase [Bradyrhizobium sp.]|jgi:nicotinamidase-related amidase|uniref:cysteine hydrolase family protein n=1 Tax=Bradyrhizobium sp. TaxID=376 RepID=UPI002B4985C2|nr:cysteine hydrolase [Bradyrhizobium sp.]HKO72184.1 cysteine hydrolase [Bradyrhizobium sp.]
MAVTTLTEPITDAVHLSVDMQNIFARGGVWETPWMERVLPVIVEIAGRYATRTVFTRFITPMNATDRPGRWRRYFDKWHRATRAELPSSELELVPALRRFVPPARLIDKPAYSAFSESPLVEFLLQKNVSTLVVTGAETDVCVLASVLDAVDLGFRVLLVEDAVCSSSDAGHDALMTLYRARFSEQIELIKSEELPLLWCKDM